MSDLITLSHGNGGKKMRQLIKDIFLKYLQAGHLSIDSDAAVLPLKGQQIVTSVDGFTVQPIFFPGGDIGSLCVHGTVNDLAVAGAIPCYLTLSVIIEEGFSLQKLEQLVSSIATAAELSAVEVVCGDTKVVPRGQCGEIFLTTTGIGVKDETVRFSASSIQPGDKVIINGTVGDHGTAIMLARSEFGLSSKIQSDSASVLPYCQAISDLEGVRFLRDPTRGGVATVMHEIIELTGLGIMLEQSRLPLADEVEVICEMLGYEPWFLANEGRVIAVVSEQHADKVLQRWLAIPGGDDASIIGEVVAGHQQLVLKTELGGQRIIPELSDDPLPRIC